MKNMLLVLALVCACTLQAETVPGLGTATFPTSTHSPAAQKEFIRGLLLLHVFEYPDAEKAFAAAEKLDPYFAMAYWGDAMTFNHPVWNELDVPAGQAALAKFGATPEARAARIADPRERAYMSAVEILYSGQGTKPVRDSQYAEAMQKMSEAYPKDDEVQLFYALALLGRSEGVRDVPTYLKAAAIAKAVFERNSQHPGAAHYWIHGMDDPQHAAGALVAARALSKIAPDAGHSQHMCSHIFMALGMWDDVVDANVQAMRVVDEHARAAGRPVVECGHYAIWLEYGYYQQGRIRAGDRELEECKRTGTDAATWAATHAGNGPTPSARANTMNISLVRMRGIALIEGQNWDGAAEKMQVETAGLDAVEQGYDVFAGGYAAAERGDRDAAANALATVRQLAAEVAKKPDADAEDVADLNILTSELGGLISSKAGDMAGAIMQVRAAATKYEGMAFDFGPPVTVKPPDELLGELLLLDKQPAESRDAFAAALKLAPHRAESVLGLARAENAMGDKAATTKTYGELASILRNADAGYGPLVEARKFSGAEVSR